MDISKFVVKKFNQLELASGQELYNKIYGVCGPYVGSIGAKCNNVEVEYLKRKIRYIIDRGNNGDEYSFGIVRAAEKVAVANGEEFVARIIRDIIREVY